MSDKEARLLLRYFAWAVGSVLLGFLLAVAAQLPGDAPINWRAVSLSTVQTVVSVVTFLLAAIKLPRQGSAQLAEDVDALRDLGISRQDMRPIRRAGAGDPAPWPKTPAAQVAEAEDTVPEFLPPDRHPGTHGEGKGRA